MFCTTAVQRKGILIETRIFTKSQPSLVNTKADISLYSQLLGTLDITAANKCILSNFLSSI
jgi:hypothetical protein